MVLTKISEVASSIALGTLPEERVGMIADGTAKAGWLVGNSTGTIAGCDSDGVDTFIGILDKRYDTDLDTIPAAAVVVDVIKPVSGRYYAVMVTDLNQSGAGIPLIFGATAGSLSVQAAVEGITVATTEKYDDGDTVAIVRWK